MRLTSRELNRALLARQGLLEPFDAAVPEVVRAIGPLQAQHWPSLPVALWSRMRDFSPDQLHDALGAGDLVLGTSLRRTIHLVTAAEHPACAVIAEAAGFNQWHRTSTTPSPEASGLRSALLEYLARTRTTEEIGDFVEAWIAAHPGAIDEAEQAVQRRYKWRPLYTWSALQRVPADGVWSAKKPAAFQAASHPPGTAEAPDPEQAIDTLVRCHVRAFGPSGAADIAGFIGGKIAPVRDALERLQGELEQFTDDAGRTLHDFPESPRPAAGSSAPVRFLPSFDSVLLAHASDRRQRILPDEYKDKVYARANLRLEPTVLIDGMVAGTWSLETRRRVATLTVRLFIRPGKKVRAELQRQGERLARFSQPRAREYEVALV